MTTKSNALLPLVTKLKAAPSRDGTFSEKMLFATWQCFRQTVLEQRDQLTPAIMSGLVLYDEKFAQLLNEAERSRMVSLARLALERYQQETNPPNKLGKIIAASLKEKT